MNKPICIKIIALVSLAVGVALGACTSSSGGGGVAVGADSGAGGTGENPFSGPDDSSFDQLTIAAEEDALEAMIGAEVQLSARAAAGEEDGRDVTDDVEWSSSDTDVATFSDDHVGRLTAVAAGEITVTAKLESADLEAKITFTVVAPQRVSLSIDPPDATVAIGEEAGYTATAQLSNDEEEDVTALVEWTTSDPAVAVVGNDGEAKGVATVNGPGTAEITATLDDLSATATLSADCPYPDNNDVLGYDLIMPNVGWDGAFMPDGSQASFFLRDFFCSSAYAEFNSVMLYIGAGWCPACRSYLQNLRPVIPQIEAAGVLTVFINTQDANYNPANTEYTNRYMDGMIGPGVGIRAGDSDTRPTAGFFHYSPVITALPSVFVVRKRDMRVIAEQARSDFILPYIDIGHDPEADWSDPGTPPFIPQCDESDEEVYEPNNTREQAAVLEPGSFDGGICDLEPDFYRINLSGPWRLTIEFSHDVGDLDLNVWHIIRDEPMTVGTEPIGSTSSTDNESFEYDGRATVRVSGYQRSSSPYRLTLEAL